MEGARVLKFKNKQEKQLDYLLQLFIETMEKRIEIGTKARKLEKANWIFINRQNFITVIEGHAAPPSCYFMPVDAHIEWFNAVEPQPATVTERCIKFKLTGRREDGSFIFKEIP